MVNYLQKIQSIFGRGEKSSQKAYVLFNGGYQIVLNKIELPVAKKRYDKPVQCYSIESHCCRNQAEFIDALSKFLEKTPVKELEETGGKRFKIKILEDI